MELRILARHSELDDGFRELVEQQLEFALRRLARRVAQVVVSFTDLNGPRGGMDQQCRIVVSLLPRGVVVAEATEARALSALNRAVESVAQRLRRSLHFTQDLRRRIERRNRHRPAA
jgi:ribosome-associated translation inhibitor RaiA